MQSQNFTTSFLVDQSPAEAFANIHDVRAWWTGGEIEGGTDKLGDEFTYRVPDVHYSKQKITELVPDKKIAWCIVDAYLNFTDDPREWTGTEITFEIARRGDQTEVRFAHQGLVPEFECFDVCSNAWGSLVNGNLRKLITTGHAQSNVFANNA